MCRMIAAPFGILVSRLMTDCLIMNAARGRIASRFWKFLFRTPMLLIGRKSTQTLLAKHRGSPCGVMLHGAGKLLTLQRKVHPWQPMQRGR
jgi:hypothetical protein